jgi:hypothetical protein
MAELGPIIDATVGAEGGDSIWTKRRGDAGGETVGGRTRKNSSTRPWWKNLDNVKARHPSAFAGEGPVDLNSFDDFDSAMDVEIIVAGVLADYHRDGQLTRSVHCTEIESQAVAGKLFDCKINGGPVMLKACVRAVQKVVGVTVDGGLGPQTLAGLNVFTEAYAGAVDGSIYEGRRNQLLITIAQAMCLRYARICKANPDQLVNLAGWVNRAFGHIS